MQKFWKTKKFWLIFFGIIILGLVIYFIFFAPRAEIFEEELEEEIPEELMGDKKAPSSKIAFPEESSFHNKDFLVKVWDVDTGGSSLNINQCKYSIYNCSNTGCRLTFLDQRRICNDNILITVGERGLCFSEGMNVCRVIVKSKDRAGNSNIISEAEDSIRDFSIDLTPPKVEILTMPLAQEGIIQTVSAQVSDNIEISNCDFYIDGKSQYQLCLQQEKTLEKCAKIINFSETSCPDKLTGKCYIISKEYALTGLGAHTVYASCWDRAGNLGYSEVIKVEIPINHPPQISFCKVNPTRGTIQADFQFAVEAADPDGDELFYFWEFGDGVTVEEKNPVHRYTRAGTYEPRVIVSDGKGGETKCSTAWVTIMEK